MVQWAVAMGRRLFRQAESDLASGRHLLLPGSFYGAAIFAREAAEKALKAAHFHVRAEEPAYRHDLAACAERIAERTAAIPPTVLAAIARLDPLSGITRYPSGDVQEPIPAELIDEQRGQRAITDAEAVLRWVRPLLDQPPGKAGRKRPS